MAQDWIEEATIRQLQDMMSSGHTTSRELVWAYMERIGQYDKQGPALNSVLELNPESLFIAESLDRERAQKGPRGPLHGIPVLLKDNIDTGDMMHTSAGSLALAKSYAPEDSCVAARLRRAGAVILGKANMTEWANFMTDNMPNGYSSRGGQVRSPYGPGKHDVGGSSSGPGAAVAASLVTVAVGTETSGSILNPACNNSIVGIKPTVGLISRAGIIPISHVQDTAGPMARTVEDAALLLGALTGVDSKDPATWSIDGRAHSDYSKFLNKDSLRGARIGVARAFYEKLDKERLVLMEEAETVLRQAGAELVDVPMQMPSGWRTKSLHHEFKPALNSYLSRLAPEVPVHSLKDLVQFNNKEPYKMLRYGQTVLLESEATNGSLTDPAYIEGRIREERLSRSEGIDRALHDGDVQVLLFPLIMNASISAKAGYPSITVPIGYLGDGRPVGMTFAGTAYSEPDLIRFSYSYEQISMKRRSPKLI